MYNLSSPLLFELNSDGGTAHQVLHKTDKQVQRLFCLLHIMRNLCFLSLENFIQIYANLQVFPECSVGKTIFFWISLAEDDSRLRYINLLDLWVAL